VADGQDLKTRFSGPSESPGLLLWRTTMRWQRVMTAALAPLDLTHVQFVLLASAMWLGRNGEPPNQVQLAAQAGTEVKMTSDVVARLEAKVMFEAIVTRFSGLALDGEPADFPRLNSTIIDGFAEVPIHWDSIA